MQPKARTFLTKHGVCIFAFISSESLERQHKAIQTAHLCSTAEMPVLCTSSKTLQAKSQTNVKSRPTNAFAPEMAEGGQNVSLLPGERTTNLPSLARDTVRFV